MGHPAVPVSGPPGRTPTQRHAEGGLAKLAPSSTRCHHSTEEGIGPLHSRIRPSHSRRSLSAAPVGCVGFADATLESPQAATRAVPKAGGVAGAQWGSRPSVSRGAEGQGMLLGARLPAASVSEHGRGMALEGVWGNSLRVCSKHQHKTWRVAKGGDSGICLQCGPEKMLGLAVRGGGRGRRRVPETTGTKMRKSTEEYGC